MINKPAWVLITRTGKVYHSTFVLSCPSLRARTRTHMTHVSIAKELGLHECKSCFRGDQ